MSQDNMPLPPTLSYRGRELHMEDVPLERTPQGVLTTIRSLLSAQGVYRLGSSYRFDLPAFPTNVEGSATVPASGEAKIAGGFLRSVTFRPQSSPTTTTFEFAQINSAPPVEPPTS